MNCPKCQADIPNSHINIVTDVAQCVNCNHIFKISENISPKEVDVFDIKNPPSGAWLNQDFNLLRFGATTRSYMAWFLVPFTCVWSGFSVGSIYGSQIISGHFNLIESLLGLPFLIGSVALISYTLMMLFGKVELTLDSEGGKIFTGIGFIGRTQSFNWQEITSVSEEVSYSRKGNSTTCIQLEGKKRVSFGSLLNDERRFYIFKSLQQILTKGQMKKGFV